MLERKIFSRLTAWKRDPNKKAICILGARQTGKTTIVENFGKQYYEYFVELNFITDPEACRIFNGSLRADVIVENLTAYTMQQMEPGKTLVFLDEIQECPTARTAMKFLVEDGRFDYIESGSMLGVKYKDIRSYPVGFEEILYMYPMSFGEFLRANGVQESTLSLLRRSMEESKPVPETIHQVLLNLFSAYVVVGGMPAAVQTYVDTHDIAKVVGVQRDILELYRLDIAKYSLGTDKLKIRSVFDSIPAQLNQKNRRFFLHHVDENGRYRRYENTFLWLKEAGMALPCCNVSEPQMPLQLNEKRNLFKLYMSDVGLLCAAFSENPQFALLTGDLTVNRGSILENAFAQEIRSNGFQLNYYESKQHGEVDFVMQNGMQVDLIEVKSGKDYKRHPALNHISQVDGWNFGRKIVFCKSNVERDGEIEYLPWYMILFYQPEAIPEHFVYQVDLSGLPS